MDAKLELLQNKCSICPDSRVLQNVKFFNLLCSCWLDHHTSVVRSVVWRSKGKLLKKIVECTFVSFWVLITQTLIPLTVILSFGSFVNSRRRRSSNCGFNGGLERNNKGNFPTLHLHSSSFTNKKSLHFCLRPGSKIFLEIWQTAFKKS